MKQVNVRCIADICVKVYTDKPSNRKHISKCSRCCVAIGFSKEWALKCSLQFDLCDMSLKLMIYPFTLGIFCKWKTKHISKIPFTTWRFGLISVKVMLASLFSNPSTDILYAHTEPSRFTSSLCEHSPWTALLCWPITLSHVVMELGQCPCVCVCVCVCVRACVRLCMFLWFMRTQICIIIWVWHRYYKEKVI